jgi:hypothetical protein
LDEPAMVLWYICNVYSHVGQVPSNVAQVPRTHMLVVKVLYFA